MMLDLLQLGLALNYIKQGHPCDRCTERAEYAVLCSNGCYHTQCLTCALYTDKERRWEAREFANLN